MMKLSQLAALVAVADEGSFTRAAQVLTVSQSAVSHAISGLESELRVVLMTRDRSGVTLTPAGHRVLTHARAILGHTEQIREETRAPSVLARRTIRIATGQAFGGRLLAQIVSALRGRFPDLAVMLHEGTDEVITRMLRENAADVGIVTLPKPDMVTFPLLYDDLCVVLPAGHSLCEVSELTPRHLSTEPLILPRDGVEPLLESLCRQTGGRLEVTHRMSDLQALLAMVAEGLAVSVLPRLALPAVLPPLRVRPLTPAVRRALAIGVSAGAGREPLVAAFVSIAQSLARATSGHDTASQARPAAAAGGR